MASTGNVFAGAGATVDRAGSTLWTNPGNITSDNATNATSTVPTDYLIASSFGFSSSVPANVAIRGITVRVEMAETGTGSSNYVVQLSTDTTPTLVGNVSGTITVTTGPTISTTGGIADLWGTTLTAAQVRAAGFGVTLWSTDTINALQCDFITIAVEWTDVPNAWSAEQYFRKRKNLTHRRRLDALFNDQYPATPAAPEPSDDRALEEPFRTVTLRSRRSLSIGWMAALTVPTPQPVSAWLAPIVHRRRETVRRLIVVDHAVIERYTPPSIAWSDPPKVVRVEFRRKVQALPPQVELPQPAAPPTAQHFPAWAITQLPPTFQDRRALSVPELNVYPETPAVEASDDRTLEEAFRTRKIRSRRLQRVPSLPSAPATPAPQAQPISAVTPAKTKRRKHRQGLFLSGGNVVEARIQPQFPSYATRPVKKRASTERRLLRLPGLASTPQTPAVGAQPVSAWRWPKQHRVENRRKLQRAAPQITHPATPAVGAQPEGAWRAPRQYWKQQDRKLLPQAPQITYPQTPVSDVATRLVLAFKRRDTKRTLRSVKHEPLYTQTPVPFQPPTAWRLATVFRRFGWRLLRTVLEIDEYPESPNPTDPKPDKTLRIGKPKRTHIAKAPHRTAKAKAPKRTEEP